MTKLPTEEQFRDVNAFREVIESRLSRKSQDQVFQLAFGFVRSQSAILQEMFGVELSPLFERIVECYANEKPMPPLQTVTGLRISEAAMMKFDEIEGDGKTLFDASELGIKYFRAHMAASAVDHLILMCTHREHTAQIASWAITEALESALLDEELKMQIEEMIGLP